MPTPPVPPRVRRPTDRRQAHADGSTDWHLRHREIVHSSRDTYLPREHAPQPRRRVAALRGLETPSVPEDPRVHLTVPPGTRIRHRADRRIHVAALPARFVQLRAGVRVTSPGRTWLDLAASLPRRRCSRWPTRCWIAATPRQPCAGSRMALVECGE